MGQVAALVLKFNEAITQCNRRPLLQPTLSLRKRKFDTEPMAPSCHCETLHGSSNNVKFEVESVGDKDERPVPQRRTQLKLAGSMQIEEPFSPLRALVKKYGIAVFMCAWRQLRLECKGVTRMECAVIKDLKHCLDKSTVATFKKAVRHWRHCEGISMIDPEALDHHSGHVLEALQRLTEAYGSGTVRASLRTFAYLNGWLK